MTSSVVYKGNLRTTCSHLKSASFFETDAPEDNYGQGQRFSPTDLLATSLATCMITVMGIKARSMDIDMIGMKAEVEKIMKTDPRRVSEINLTFYIPQLLKNIDEEQKIILKNVAVACPVQLSIHPDIQVSINWNW